MYGTRFQGDGILVSRVVEAKILCERWKVHRKGSQEGRVPLFERKGSQEGRGLLASLSLASLFFSIGLLLPWPSLPKGSQGMS